MANVTTLFKVMPADEQVSLKDIREELDKTLEVEDSDTEDVAFGLQALMILVQIPEEEGTDRVREEIEDVDGVKTVDVQGVNRE